MEPELFTPSYNWGAAPLDSLIWIGRAWVISAICLVVVLITLRYVSVWGQQYWRITRGFFVGPQSGRAWLMLGVLLLSIRAKFGEKSCPLALPPIVMRWMPM